MEHTTYIILDLEATGLRPEKGDVIIDIAAVRCSPMGIVDNFQSFVHPGEKEISPFIQQLTGITPEKVAGAPHWDEVLIKFKSFLGDTPCPIVGHNVSFDTHFLNHYGCSFKDEQLVDTNDFSLLFFPEAPSHSLEVLASLFQFAHEEKHTALSDVHATYALLQQLLLKRDGCSSDQIVQIKHYFHESSWGGKHFFTLPREGTVQALSLTIPKQSDVVSSYAPLLSEQIVTSMNEERGELAIFSHGVQPKDILPSLSQSTEETIVYLVDRENMPTYNKDSLSLFSSSDLIDGDKIKNFIDHHELGYELFALRMLLGVSYASILHVDSLTLSYEEKSLIKQCVFRISEDPTHLQQFLSQFRFIYTSLSHYFYSPLSSFLQSYQYLIVDEVKSFESRLIDSGRKTISTDLTSFFDKAVTATVRLPLEQQSYATDLLMDMRALLLAPLESAFSQVSKSTTAQFYPMEQTWSESYISTVLAALQKLTDFLSTFSEIGYFFDFFFRMKEDFAYLSDQQTLYTCYIKSYNATITCVFERKDSAAECSLIASKPHWMAWDTSYDEQFSYVLPCTALLSLEGIEKNTSLPRVRSATSPYLDLEDTTRLFGTYKKIVLLCFQNIRADKLYDTLIDKLSTKEYPVLSMGRSGGKQKTLHNFLSAEKSVLVLKYQDFLKTKDELHADYVVLDGLPFTMLQGPYFEEKYQRSLFSSVSLPLVIHQLQKTITALSTVGVKEILLIDARLREKEYGKTILKSLDVLI